MAELKLLASKAEAKVLNPTLMDEVMRKASFELERMMGEKLKMINQLDNDMREVKAKQMIDSDDIMKLRNESIMA